MTGQKTSDMTLEQALMSGKPVIAKLGASWCPPCRQMAPIIEELKTEMEGQAIVLDIDIQQRPDLSKKYKVTYIPLTLFFNGQGQLMDQQVGFMTKQQVLAKFHSM
jgi:thioredoxin 1